MVSAENLGAFGLVPMEVEGILDRRTMTVEQILALEEGSLIRLDRSAGENIDVCVGAKPVAYGEVMVVENRFCIRVTDINELPH
jgi:flagellar motor switch protein FliN/FliY